MNHSAQQWNERALLGALALFGLPGTMIDLGCGAGDMVRLANRIGIHAVGVDIDPPGGEEFIKHDLTQPLKVDKAYDLIVCLETGEHLPEQAASILCKTIARARHPHTRLLFSAAAPGQGGEHHLNLQHGYWWRDLLHETGHWSYRRNETMELSLMWSMTTGPLRWLAGNVQVF